MLIAKFKKYGVNGALLEWIRSYLRNRMQSVIIENELSDYQLVKVGVPPGSERDIEREVEERMRRVQ